MKKKYLKEYSQMHDSNVIIVGPYHNKQYGGIEKICELQSELLKCTLLHNDRLLLRKPFVNPWMLFRKVRDKKSRILIVHGFSSFLPIICFLICKLSDCKFIWQPHYHPFRHNNNPMLSWLMFYCLNVICALGANKILVISKTEDLFFRKFNNRVEFISHPVELKQIQHPENTEAKSLLFIGRNDKNKNIKYLIQNYGKIAEYFDEIVVVTDKYPRVGESRLSKLNVIITPGEEQLRELMLRCAAVIVPSLYEAFSLVTVEAVLCGKPVIASSSVQVGHYPILRECVFNLDETCIEECMAKARAYSISERRLYQIRKYFSFAEYKKNLNESIWSIEQSNE